MAATTNTEVKTVKLNPEATTQDESPKEEEMSLDEAQEKIKDLQEEGKLNKPTEKEINEAVDDFNAKAKVFNEKVFEIGEAEKADEIYDFLIEFIDKYVYWTKNGWMGVIKMYDELKEGKKNRKEGQKFGVGYQALEFLFYALSNPGGTGLKSAKAIEKVADIYIEVYEESAKILEKARQDLQEIQFLQDKVAAMQQGFYLEKEDEVDAEGANQSQNTAFQPPSADDLLKK